MLVASAHSSSDGFFGHLVDASVYWLSSIESTVTARLVLTALTFIIVGATGRFVGKWLEGSAKRAAAKQRLDDWQTRALISRTKPLRLAIKLGLGIVAIGAVLFIWGLQTAFVSLLTAAGFAGIVIGMAASNTLSNLIAGFIIFYNQPFNIGDWVNIEGEEGIITDVQAGATMLLTWDGEKVTLPNRVVEGAKVKNFSHQRQLRRRFRIGIDYATDIAKAMDILLETIKSHPFILQDPEPQVVGVEFGDSAIILETRFWIAPLRANALLIQTWYMQEIQRQFAKHGIVIPFPQRTVVYRYEQGNPPPGDTVSRLAYDPNTDDRPTPLPPIQPPLAKETTHQMQEQHPSHWFDELAKPFRKKRTNDGANAAPTSTQTR